MNPFQPIYTEKARCQDCYRCVRNCPVKAIKIENGVASVIESLCIYCGKCVNSCPAGAKKVRNDRTLARMLLGTDTPVIASLAPSYVSEFPDIPAPALIAAIKRLGFFGVSETALGAQEVSTHAAELLDDPRAHTWISSACPTVVEYLRKYRPELSETITPLLSPLLAHCKLLKKRYGERVNVVFFGPCIAKKREAHLHPELLSAALTFDDLRAMFEEDGIKPDQLTDARESFIPGPAAEGALFPVDGGMIACMKQDCQVTDRCAMHFSGMDEVCSVLDSAKTPTDHSLFLELLACAGGCINGPVTRKGSGTLERRIAILGHAVEASATPPRPREADIREEFPAQPVGSAPHSDAAILEVLRSTGKQTPQDELNCGGCGYANCRAFASAVLDNTAEIAMCVTYMRRLAHKKANKLIMAMPSGVVIADKNMRIIECNSRFAALAGEDAVSINEQYPGLGGAALEKVLPVAHLFRHVLDTGEDILDRDLKIGNRVMHCSVFTIEPGIIAGGVFNDVTAPELKKEEVIKRARSVIRKNLMTVQKIAYLLGENASETEIVLSTIIDSFNDPGEDDAQR